MAAKCPECGSTNSRPEKYGSKVRCLDCMTIYEPQAKEA